MHTLQVSAALACHPKFCFFTAPIQLVTVAKAARFIQQIDSPVLRSCSIFRSHVRHLCYCLLNWTLSMYFKPKEDEMSAAIQRVTGEIPACLVLLLLWSCSLQAQMLTGEYYLTEATFEGTRITGLSATFQFTSASDYAATFATSSYNGSAKSQFRLSAGKDTLVDQLPKDISLTGGRSSTINGKLLYQIMLTTSQEVWDKGGQTALGYGWPAGATASKVLITIGTDSTLLLKSLDGKTVLTYAHSGKLFAHNIVTFQVDMRIQQKLARFAPNQGDIVLVRGNFNDWKGNAAAMTATATPGIFAYKHDFSADWIGRALQYNFIIHKTDGQESVEKIGRASCRERV